MGNKINANGLRVGFTKPWSASWFAEKPADYQKNLETDMKIREYISERFKSAGIQNIKIIHNPEAIQIEVIVAKPGVAIGRGGQLIEEVKRKLSKMIGQIVQIKPIEEQEPSLAARIIARQIADGIEKRRSEKMLVNKAIERAKRRGVKGIKIQVGGRLRASLHSNKIKQPYGRVPLQTIRANIDYAFEEAQTANAGILGVKVWVYKGEKFE